MQIKYDQKVIMAIRAGLLDGSLYHNLKLPLKDCYYTKKESRAYKYAASLTENGLFNTYWKAGYNDIQLLELAIEESLINPIGWAISRHIDSDLIPFIEITI